MNPQLDITAFTIADVSQISQARRHAGTLATALGFNEEMAGKLAIAVTEAGNNLLRHANGGRMVIQTLPELSPANAGVEVIAVDKGPGIKNVAECMRDGHSSIGTAGTGLGAISRLTTGFEIYSSPGNGTAMRFECWRTPSQFAIPSPIIGTICVPLRGEEASGDAWLFDRNASRSLLVVVDGLGHGLGAASAARAAIDSFARFPQASPVAMMEMAHDALRPTRGAAAAIASFDVSSGKGIFCGVGNISCVVVTGERHRNLVSFNGTLGHNARKIQSFEFEFPAGSLLIMHSDGLATRWNLDRYPSLINRHPSLIAAVLWRDFERGRDDVTVAVVRNMN